MNGKTAVLILLGQLVMQSLGSKTSSGSLSPTVPTNTTPTSSSSETSMTSSNTPSATGTRISSKSSQVPASDTATGGTSPSSGQTTTKKHGTGSVTTSTSSGLTADKNETGHSSSTSGPGHIDTTSNPPDNCYDYNCSAKTDSCLEDDLKNKSIHVGTCPRNAQYCLVRRNEKGGVYSMQATCVEKKCDYQDVTTSVTGHTTTNCCNSRLCNTQDKLSTASNALPGILPVMLAAAVSMAAKYCYGLVA